MADEEMAMSEHNDDERLVTSKDQVPEHPEAAEATPEEAFRESHAARAQSAASRAAATCHYIEQRGLGENHEDGPAEKEIVWKATRGARVSAQAVALISESALDPAADSRCARNASASACQTAEMGQLHDGKSDLAVAAYRAALKASMAAAEAALAGNLGRDMALNAAADAAETTAVAAAEEAGWMEPGQHVPQVSLGVRSPEMMAMMHL
ncbi:hypothetical protein [Streptomyces sp. H27-C3]|uniref:hypothetical protein n=1 Tax=Streptomyces sp. H27-C3 TaxID=3046305 RepID=UPI0024BA11D6|nr:hypothetical protein [Streptomyces sp. H27-C3]MDJ0461487.1 hypothetical protein [Streptomyces sp. H27-C3]